MVPLGGESGLSVPISFESLREGALFLAKPDVTTHDGIEVIRVALATAVHFVADLQQREELAFPASAPNLAVESALCPHARLSKILPANRTNLDEWVEKFMEIADDEGVDNVTEVQKAVLTVKALYQGQSRPIDFWPPFDVGSWR